MISRSSFFVWAEESVYDLPSLFPFELAECCKRESEPSLSSPSWETERLTAPAPASLHQRLRDRSSSRNGRDAILRPLLPEPRFPILKR